MPTQVCVHIGAQELPSPLFCCIPGWILIALHLEGGQGATVCPAHLLLREQNEMSGPL